jgi:hypothetical protein
LAPIVAFFQEYGNPHPVYYLTVVACIMVGLLSNWSALKMSAYVKRQLKNRK